MTVTNLQKQAGEMTNMEEICFRSNMTRYLNHCKYEKGLDNNTLKAYRIDLMQFYEYSEQINTDNQNQNLQNYIVSLHSKYKIKNS